MKFWKSKKFIGGLALVICTGVGVANPALVADTATNAVCSFVVKCSE